MRLSEVQAILSTVDINKTRLSFKIDSTSNLHIIAQNINAFKQFLNIIQPFPFFKKEIIFIKNSELYSTSQDELRLLRSNYEKVSSTAIYLSNAAEALSRVLGVINSESDNNSIFIKLPCTNDFQLLINDLSEFEKSINQVITNDIIDGHLQIRRWESGSFWVELMLGSQLAVALIASIAWSATVISKKSKEGQIIEQHVRSLNIKNESLQDLLEKQKEATKLIIQNEVKNIQVKYFGSDADNEYFERLRLTTKTFAELIQKGSEIHPALNAPEQVNNLFPNFKQLGTVVSQIKQIEESTTENG